MKPVDISKDFWLPQRFPMKSSDLEKIANTLSIESVIVEGKYLPRAELDRMLKEIKAWVKAKESRN